MNNLHKVNIDFSHLREENRIKVKTVGHYDEVAVS